MERSRLLLPACLAAFLAGWVASTLTPRELSSIAAHEQVTPPRAAASTSTASTIVASPAVVSPAVAPASADQPPPRAAAPGTSASPAPPSATPSVDPAPRDPLHVAYATRRLQARLAAAPRPQSSRNPFEFDDRRASRNAAPPSRDETSAPIVPAAPVAPPPPLFTLSGIAEHQIDGARVRTAILSSAGRLIFARTGDRLDDRHVVIAIATDVVELRDETDGRTIHVALP